MPVTTIDSLASGLAFLPVQFSRNQIEYVIEAADTTLSNRAGLRYFLELLIPEFTGSSSFKRLLKMPGSEKPPASGGGLAVYEGAFYQLDELLDGFLDYQKPDFGQKDMAIISTLTMPYKVTQSVENNGVAMASMAKVLPDQYILKGGLTRRDFAAWGNLFFTTYMSANRPFLTWQPDFKVIGETQPEYLYFLLNISPLPTTFTRRVRVTYLNGTVETVDKGTISGAVSHQVICLPAHPAALGLDAKNVASVEVWLADKTQNRLSQVRTYLIDHTFRNQERHLLLSNSLGGWDTIRLLGEGAETLTTQRTTAQFERPAGAPADFAELRVINVQGTRELTVSTGYLEQQPLAQLRYLDELLLANQIYLVDGQGHQALELTTTNLVDVEDNSDLVARTFSFRWSAPQVNFSNLPAAPAVSARPTKWRGVGINYAVDSFGKRTGLGRPLKLQKYYTDDNTTFKPLTEKPNVPGDPDFINYLPVPGVVAGSSPFLSQAINRAIDYSRANCTGGQIGGPASYAVAAEKYGSETSQTDADSRAEAEFALYNNQAYADKNGTCTIAPVSPELYTATVNSGEWRYRVSDQKRFEIYYYTYPNTEPIIGNTWDIQGQNRPYVYQRFTTDLAFPVKPEKGWLVLIYGPAGSTLNLKVYVDGVLKSDTNYLANPDGYEHIQLPVLPLSGQKLYLKLTTL